jgi:hypothetical protein
MAARSPASGDSYTPMITICPYSPEHRNDQPNKQIPATAKIPAIMNLRLRRIVFLPRNQAISLLTDDSMRLIGKK